MGTADFRRRTKYCRIYIRKQASASVDITLAWRAIIFAWADILLGRDATIFAGDVVVLTLVVSTIKKFPKIKRSNLVRGHRSNRESHQLPS